MAAHQARPQAAVSGLVAGYRALQRIGVAVRSHVDPRPVLDGLVADAVRLLDLRLCALALCEETGRVLQVVHESRRGQSAVHSMLGRRLDPSAEPIDESFGRPLFTDHRSVVRPSAGSPAGAPLPLFLAGLESHHLVLAPITAEQRTLGLLIAVRDAEGPAWLDAEVEFLMTAADLSAVALQHAFTRSQLRVLTAFPSELHARPDIALCLRRLVESAMQVTRATGGLAGLREGDVIVCRERRLGLEWQPLELKFTRDRGLAGWCWTNRVPCVSHEAEQDPRADVELMRDLRVSAALTVPIVDREGEVMGFFELHDKAAGLPFGEEDIRLARSMAHQAALALEAGRL